MTTPAPIPSTISLAQGHEEAPTAFARLHLAGILALTPAELGSLRQADTLHRAARAAGERLTAADKAQNDVRLKAIGAMSVEARDTGRVDESAMDAYLAHLEELPRLKQRYDVLGQAAFASAAHVNSMVLGWARSALGGRLVEALDRILDDAAAHARIMADVRGFDYGDPVAVFRADKPVQAAFGALVPLADRHDQLRRAAATLWGTLPRNETFPAPPVELRGCGLVAVPVPYAPDRWTWQPEGHPVERIVRAVTERDAAAEDAA